MASFVISDILGPPWWFVALILFSSAGKETIKKCTWASLCAQQQPKKEYVFH